MNFNQVRRPSTTSTNPSTNSFKSQVPPPCIQGTTISTEPSDKGSPPISHRRWCHTGQRLFHLHRTCCRPWPHCISALDLRPSWTIVQEGCPGSAQTRLCPLPPSSKSLVFKRSIRSSQRKTLSLIVHLLFQMYVRVARNSAKFEAHACCFSAKTKSWTQGFHLATSLLPCLFGGLEDRRGCGQFLQRGNKHVEGSL